jgi:hypothetical protein
MKKSMLSIGKKLSKSEQQSINGGWVGTCFPSEPKCLHYCPTGNCNPCGPPDQGFTPHVCEF